MYPKIDSKGLSRMLLILYSKFCAATDIATLSVIALPEHRVDDGAEEDSHQVDRHSWNRASARGEYRRFGHHEVRHLHLQAYNELKGAKGLDHIVDLENGRLGWDGRAHLRRLMKQRREQGTGEVL